MFYKVFYTDKFIPATAAGATRLMFIFIRPKYKDDVGLLQHELKHVEQLYRNPLHSYFYLLSKSYRLKCEVEAYKEQLKHYANDRTDLFAEFIAKYYNLNITQEEAKQLLLN